jgi:PhnB protein
MTVKWQPDGYHTLTPYLIVRGGAAAIDFYKKAFGAVELFRMPMPDGKLGHAEIKIGNSVIMLADEAPERGATAPDPKTGYAVGFMVYVEKVDAVFDQAVKAGAKVIMPVKNQFYGDRSGTVADPFGHKWTIGTHVEDVSPEEMTKRMADMAKQGQPA